MNQRGKIKSFGVLKTATIGGIVTAVFVALPIAFVVILFAFSRGIDYSTHKTLSTPDTVVQPSTVATPTAVQPNQAPEKKHPRPVPLQQVPVRIVLMMMVLGPLIYGIFGLLAFGLWSWLYNLLSPRFGGIEIEWTDGPEEKPPLS